jgi:hypothetical protein
MSEDVCPEAPGECAEMAPPTSAWLMGELSSWGDARRAREALASMASQGVRDAIAKIRAAGDVHAACAAWFWARRWAQMLPEGEQAEALARIDVIYRAKVS